MARDSRARKPAPTKQDDDAQALDRVVARVKRDARERPDHYLSRTEVPGGGE